MDLPVRPVPARSPTATVETALASVVAWLRWWGPIRLAGTLAVVAGVAVAGTWLLRAPEPPAEAVLPPASSVPGAAFVAGAGSGAGSGAGLGSVPDGPGSPTRSGGDDAPALVVVHVAGAVVDPGVHQLTTGARVVDAIHGAGGATPAAELDALNLAAVVADGARIYVPEVGELSVPLSVGVAGGDTASGADGSTPSGPLDLNRATAAELETLPGVGPATAAAIVDHRERFGPFATVDDLDAVSGIGPAKLAAIRDLVTT